MLNKISKAFEIIINRSILIFISAIKNILLSSFLKYVFGHKYYLRRIYDFKMFLNNEDRGLSRSLTLFGKREEDQKFILEKIIKKHMKIFDIGSNIGYYVLIENQLLESTGKIVAIEPNQANIRILKKNIYLNKIDGDRINIEEYGVSNISGKKKFYLAKQSNLHTFHPKGSAKDFLTGEISHIKTITISELSKKYFKPDFIRMDVEGHEVEILSSIIRDIKRNFFRPVICFEPHISSYNKNHNLEPILTNLFELGYKTRYLSSNSNSGTKRITAVTNKKPIKVLKSDGEIRSIFENINSCNTIDILTKTGGARTVLISK